MTDKQSTTRKPLVSWALYDWANSAYATTVMAGFFPLFFKQYWSQDTPVTTSTFYLGMGNSLASLIIVIAAPVLGAMADQGNLRKRMLASFACAGILACIGFFFVGKGMWPAAIALYVIGIIGFSGANVFYDSLLVLVSPPDSRHRDSALGFALGYLGGGLLFLVNVIMTIKPALFGLADAAEAVRWSFLSVGLWWALFSIPLFLNVKEQDDTTRQKSTSPVDKPPVSILIRSAFASLLSTLKSIRQHRNVWLFLLSYWLYIDGVATIIRMAVDYGLSIGLPANSLIIALLMVQFIGFPATIIFGRLAERIGARRGLWIALWVYVVATGYAVFMTSATEFYVLAVALGLVQGATQSLSRSLFSHLIPQEKSGEYFGFMNMMGKAAAVVGPVLVGVVAYLTEDSRLGLLSILILFFAGMWMLRLVEEPDHTVRL
ncbi:MFS transporter [Chromatiales bacterium (ex Bugula neritina AB1)]|nr:MFS transporter [Chromatiales bacterium (ex Bugula neritina AB1)]